jgi:hypothetical protein
MSLKLLKIQWNFVHAYIFIHKVTFIDIFMYVYYVGSYIITSISSSFVII